MSGYPTNQLGQVQLGATLTTIYTAPSFPPNARTRVKSLWIANTDSAARTVTLRVGTGTLTAANGLMEAVSIPANTSYFMESDNLIVMSAGQVLQGLSDSASKITVTVVGEEFQ